MKKNDQIEGLSQDLSRRDFLVNTALIGAGLAVGPLLGIASAENTDKRTGKGLPKGGNKMKIRTLGKLEVSAIGAGCMNISANYGPPADRTQGIKVIRTAYEKGVTVPIQTKSLSGKHLHLSATKLLSQPNLVLTL
jgi:hypothetical protein